MNKSDYYLVQYREAIRSGEIIAGQELIMELDRLIADLDNPKYIYDTTESRERMDFMEGCIRLTKSPFYGKPMKLMLWQKAFIEVIYSFKMADTGFDRFKKIVLLIGRKNTKSETCSALGLTEGFEGPDGADIVCSSNDDAQANILYEAINTMRLMIDPKSQDTHKNINCISIKEKGSKIFKLSDRTHNKEGRNIDFAIVDEVHEMKDNVIIKSIEQSQSLKDNPKLIIITTEGFVNDGVLDKLLVTCRKIINGEDDSISAERTLPWLYTQDSEREVWDNPKTWTKSNPTLEIVKEWDYLYEQVDMARKSKADRMFVFSKDFNFKQSNSELWLDEKDYIYDAKFDLEDFRSAICLGAVDLAETTDLVSAKILLQKKKKILNESGIEEEILDKTKYVFQHYWITESKLNERSDKNAGAEYLEWAKAGLMTICEGNDIDVSVVADWFYQLYKEYRIRLLKCGYDQKFAKDFLKRMDEYGFEYEVIQQNMQTLSNAIKLVESDFKHQLINYNEHLVDRWCLGNAALSVNDIGQCLIVKPNNDNERKIDGAVTFAILYETYRRNRTEFIRLVR